MEGSENFSRIVQNLSELVSNEIRNTKSDEPISPDEDLIESGILDSLGLVTLLAFISREYRIDFGHNELVPENFNSIHLIAESICQKQNENKQLG